MTTHDFVGSGSGLRLQRPPGAFPRAGAWAVHEGRIGILAEVRGLTTEFHVVDAQGKTSLVMPGVPLRAVTQATLEQIPEGRRPTEAVARKLGYLDGVAPAIAVPAGATASAGPSSPRRPFLARVLSKLTRRPEA